MDGQDRPTKEDALCDFLIRIEEDQARGVVLPLAEYLARFPGHEEAVAREYLARMDEGPHAGSSDQDPTNAASADLVSRVKDGGRIGVRYEVGEEIARGGMGVVFRVVDCNLERDLAMKVHLRAGLASERRFRREARVTARLDHPGVVPVHDFGARSDGHSFFTMRLIEGKTLRDVIDAYHRGDAEWTLSRVIDVMIRVCDTMAFAHSKGITHRDLKPSNIMVGAFGEVYVMDWGVAHVRGSSDELDAGDPQAISASGFLTLDGDVLGTPAYMAPEQAVGKTGEIGPAVDIYSAGALLYHLLAGHMPYAGSGDPSSSRVILERVLRGEPARPNPASRAAPAELIAIQERAMAREPGRRYATMREIASDLRAFLEDRVVSAYAERPLIRARKWMRRNRGLSVGVVLAGAAGMIALLVYVQQRGARGRVVSLLATRSTAAAIEKTYRALWPVDPSAIPVLRRLAAEASALVSRREALTEERERLRTRALPIDPDDPAERAAQRARNRELANSALLVEEFTKTIRESDAGRITLVEPYTRAFYVGEIERHRGRLRTLETLPVAQQTFHFEDPLDQVLFDSLEDLESDHATLAGTTDRPGLVATIERSVELVLAAERRKPADLDQRWERTRRELLDEEGAALYGRLDLRPQPGLVPIGRDPTSGLFEFAASLTGEIPTRDASGHLAIDEDSAMVLVLIPGGEPVFGAQSVTEGSFRFDPMQPKGDDRLSAIRMNPFFIGKHEVTQAQWRRLTTKNPSVYQPGHAAVAVTEMHPVEYVSFEDAAPVLQSVALTFPSEAQWEHAARGGTDTPWFTGPDKESITGYANIADPQAVELFVCQSEQIKAWPAFDDGFAVHAPVNALRPNPYGLYGILGNVEEWCVDEGPLDLARALVHFKNASRIGTPSGSRPIRGGSFALSFHETRSAARRHAGPTRRDYDLGLRVARLVE